MAASLLQQARFNSGGKRRERLTSGQTVPDPTRPPSTRLLSQSIPLGDQEAGTQMQEEYWTVNVTFLKLDDDNDWVLSIDTYDRLNGRKKICQWIGDFTLTEDQLENITIIWQSLITARMNVQLGLDLGLLA